MDVKHKSETINYVYGYVSEQPWGAVKGQHSCTLSPFPLPQILSAGGQQCHVQSGTNVSLPRDEVRVNDGSEQVRLNASQRSSEAEPRSSSGEHSVGLARNRRL